MGGKQREREKEREKKKLLSFSFYPSLFIFPLPPLLLIRLFDGVKKRKSHNHTGEELDGSEREKERSKARLVVSPACFCVKSEIASLPLSAGSPPGCSEPLLAPPACTRTPDA